MSNDKTAQLSRTDEEPATTDTPNDVTTSSNAPADMQTFLGRQLRAVYDDVARQPVPDRFLELMKQLETKTTEG